MSCPFGYGRKPDAADAETASDAPTVEAIVTDGVVGLKRCECGDGETKRGHKTGAPLGLGRLNAGATRGRERDVGTRTNVRETDGEK